MTLLLPLLLATLPSAQVPEPAALEAKFAKLMTGCKMVGKFTTRKSEKPPRPSNGFHRGAARWMHASNHMMDVREQYLSRSVSKSLMVDG